MSTSERDRVAAVVLVGALVVVAVIVLVLLAYRARQALLRAFTGFFLAVGFEPWVGWRIRHGVRRGLGVALTSRGLVAVGAGLTAALVVPGLRQLGALVQEAPQLLDGGEPADTRRQRDLLADHRRSRWAAAPRPNMRTSELHTGAHAALREATQALNVRRDGTTEADLTEPAYQTLATDLAANPAANLDAVASLPAFGRRRRTPQRHDPWAAHRRRARRPGRVDGPSGRGRSRQSAADDDAPRPRARRDRRRDPGRPAVTQLLNC
jgi:hypothetical protein